MIGALVLFFWAPASGPAAAPPGAAGPTASATSTKKAPKKTPTAAQRRLKKSIWGPADASAFATYRNLGVGIYQIQLTWSATAPTKPGDARNPADAAYVWPANLDMAVAEAKKVGIKVAVLVQGTPRWANGGQPNSVPPSDVGDYADFLVAASRRYPNINHWMVWGEPNRSARWSLTVPETRRKPLTRAQQVGPKRYAELVDRAYGVLKARSRKNLVIGGMSFTTGDVAPLNWVRNLKLPSGRPPRMDMYGHNPFSGRRPALSKPPLIAGYADMSDIDTLARWVDRWIDKRRSAKVRKSKPMPIFISEFTLPTDQANPFFNLYVDRPTQASWLRDAMKIVRSYSRIYTFGWYQLRDQPPNRTGNEARWGLMESGGAKKAAYNVFRRG